MTTPPPTTQIPLDPGLTVIEASAGTGKTHRITNLVIRLVTEQGIPMREFVVVTFTRAATAELRDRIRKRLQEALDAIEAGGHKDDHDLHTLAMHCAADPALAIRRLREAQRSFDQALISTIHGFCQRMIDTHSFECSADTGLDLVRETHEVLEEIVDDWLSDRLREGDLTRYRAMVDDAKFTREDLLDLAKVATEDPTIPVLPEEDRWTPEAFRGLADMLRSRWAGPQGASVLSAIEATRAEEAADLTRRIEAAGGTVGDPIHKGKWIAETLIDELGWWPPIGERDQKTGLFKTTQENMKKWARGDLDTPPEGQAAATTLLRLLIPVDKTYDKFIDWLDTVAGPEEPTKTPSTSLDKLTSLLPDPCPPGVEGLIEDTRIFLSYRQCLATMDRVRFVQWTRTKLQERCASRRVRTYHDQLRQLARPLDDLHTEEARALVAAIGSRVRVTLIDEFQDTDALQWQIFRTLLGPWSGPGEDPRRHQEHRLFLIGDRKQAIYSFRGANLHVYQNAVSSAHGGAGQVHTLSTNYRSDEALILALEHVLGGRPGLFGDHRINFEAVKAANPDRLVPHAPPLQIRFLTPDPGDQAPLGVDSARLAVSRRVAADIVDLLTKRLEIIEGETTKRPLQLGDITILVRSHLEGRQVQDALREHQVNAINFSAQDVFKSDTATHLLAWMRALQSPGRTSLTRTAATTPLFGMKAMVLAGVDAEKPAATAVWALWMSRLQHWREGFPKRRFLATLRDAMDTCRIPERLLRRTDGDRRVSDLLHLAELIHSVETQERLGLSGLIAWLEQQRREKAEDPDSVDLRLESESGAVEIRTMHSVKGLEAPVVFAPFLWGTSRLSPKASRNLVFTNPEDATQRLLDVQMWLKHPEKLAHLERATRESREEAIRLAYVALTRARHRCVLYTGFLEPLSGSPLAPMLHGDTTPEGEDRLDHATAAVRRCTHGEEDGPGMSGLLDPLKELAASSPDHPSDPALKTITVTACAPIHTVDPWTRPQTGTDLSVRTWTRSGLNRTWKRHSYSGIIRSARGDAAAFVSASSPVMDEGRDVDQDVMEPISPQETSPGPGVPLSPFPSGKTPGKVLHEMLEHADFAWARPNHPDGEADLKEMLQARLSRHGMDAQLETLLAGLPPVLRTPLGGPLGSLCLADLDHSDRLDELRFDLPLAGGDRHRAGVHEPVDGKAMMRALLTAPSPGVPTDYLEGLVNRKWGEMSGFLNGFIDLVTRAQCTDGAQRWFVVDYKSNRLAPRSQKDVPLSTYRQERLLEEMGHHDYHLQYHLYILAVHRYLRHRIEDYDYEKDFGGALYLFVRGMVGPREDTDLDQPQPGIFFARPARAVVEALDQIIGGAP